MGGVTGEISQWNSSALLGLQGLNLPRLSSRILPRHVFWHTLRFLVTSLIVVFTQSTTLSVTPVRVSSAEPFNTEILWLFFFFFTLLFYRSLFLWEHVIHTSVSRSYDFQIKTQPLGAWLLSNVTSPTHCFLPALWAFSPGPCFRIEKAGSSNPSKM